jgi:hypothetical protein
MTPFYTVMSYSQGEGANRGLSELREEHFPDSTSFWPSCFTDDGVGEAKTFVKVINQGYKPNKQ